MQISILPFEQLNAFSLYHILRLRSEVFVVEQDCVYQDVDEKDFKALHVLGIMDDELVAYARIFDAKAYFEEAAISRVVVAKKCRKLSLGHHIVTAAISGIEEHFHTDIIKISAQLYLQSFYESHQFVQTSDMYLEDGIPHIEMKRSIKK